jgi:hypothetical protein
MVSCDLSGVQMRPRTNSGHSLSRFSVPLLPKPQYAKEVYSLYVEMGALFLIKSKIDHFHDIALA